jgi:hypothetical protein
LCTLAQTRLPFPARFLNLGEVHFQLACVVRHGHHALYEAWRGNAPTSRKALQEQKRTNDEDEQSPRAPKCRFSKLTPLNSTPAQAPTACGSGSLVAIDPLRGLMSF